MKRFAKHYPLVMRVFLGFVLLWFGISEILDPKYWSGYVPGVIEKIYPLNLDMLVQIHGLVLFLLSLALFFRFYIRFSGFIVFLVLLSIIFGLIASAGFNEIVVRDIGILGLALAIWLYEIK